MDNVYYSPESSGLRMLGSIDTGEAYEFHILAVWERVSDGAILSSEDVGCSCPDPFENDTADSLTPVRDAAEFTRELRDFVRGTYGGQRDEAERIIRKVRYRLRANG